VWLWGVGVLNCAVDHILQEFYTLFLTSFRTYKIASPPQTKLASNDDIKGLVSLKFLRPWVKPMGSQEDFLGFNSVNSLLHVYTIYNYVILERLHSFHLFYKKSQFYKWIKKNEARQV
jgi:hypothetical protein